MAGPTALVNHIWSFAGSDDTPNVNSTFIQPFLSYIFPTFTSVTINSETTYDWNAGQATVPINLLVSQIFKIGKQPMSLQVGPRYYAEGPSGGPEWGFRSEPELPVSKVMSDLPRPASLLHSPRPRDDSAPSDHRIGLEGMGVNLGWFPPRLPRPSATPNARVPCAAATPATPRASNAASRWSRSTCFSFSTAAGSFFSFRRTGGRRPCFTSSSSCDFRRRMWW